NHAARDPGVELQRDPIGVLTVGGVVVGVERRLLVVRRRHAPESDTATARAGVVHAQFTGLASTNSNASYAVEPLTTACAGRAECRSSGCAGALGRNDHRGSTRRTATASLLG